MNSDYPTTEKFTGESREGWGLTWDFSQPCSIFLSYSLLPVPVSQQTPTPSVSYGADPSSYFCSPLPGPAFYLLVCRDQASVVSLSCLEGSSVLRLGFLTPDRARIGSRQVPSCPREKKNQRVFWSHILLFQETEMLTALAHHRFLEMIPSNHRGARYPEQTPTSAGSFTSWDNSEKLLEGERHLLPPSHSLV